LIDVSLQVAHVMLADFKAPLLPADACSRDGNKVLPYQREAVPWQELKKGEYPQTPKNVSSNHPSH